MSLTLNCLHNYIQPNCTSFLGQNYPPTLAKLDRHEFQPMTQSPYFVLGEQLAKTRLFKLACRIAHSIYTNLPSFSLPLAEASEEVLCPIPTGTYETSCHKPTVKYSPQKAQCELTTRCASMYEGLAHLHTSIFFDPSKPPILENKNGSISPIDSNEEAINIRLVEDLIPGAAITIGKNLTASIIAPNSRHRLSPGFEQYQKLARDTGGIMGYLPDADNLNSLMHTISDHILKMAETSKSIDIAFVLDTTSSMAPYIKEVKNNLIGFLEKLQNKKRSCKVALIEYRDEGDEFLNRIKMDFTFNFNQAQNAIALVSTSGGGDLREAPLDALVKAEDLSWRPNEEVMRVVMLISDAAPKPRTIDGLDTQETITKRYQRKDTKIAVYPIIGE